MQGTQARRHSSMHVAAQQPAAGRTAGCLHSSACLNRMNSRQKPAAITKTPHCMWLRSSRQEGQRGMNGQPTARHGSAHKTGELASLPALRHRRCTHALCMHAAGGSCLSCPALAHPHPPHHGQRELAEHDLEAEIPHDVEASADGADLQRADLGGKHLLNGWGLGGVAVRAGKLELQAHAPRWVEGGASRG